METLNIETKMRVSSIANMNNGKSEEAEEGN
jgi:hypothetical protein